MATCSSDHQAGGTPTGRRSLRAAAGVLGVLLLTSACATDAGSADAGASAAPVRSSSAAADAPARAAGPLDRLDPLAPPTYRPVVRNGRPPHPTLSAGPGGFSPAAPVAFPDGVSLTVVRVDHGLEEGQGPGSFPGRPETALSLRLTNDSQQPVDLTQVVVTTTYGAPARLASPVYEDPAAEDFTGAVGPGGSASATYVFAIPPGQADRVVTVVDFDDLHVAARVEGRA